MEIWIPVLVAIITGAISFFASTKSSNKEVEKVKLENNSKLGQLKEQHKADLETLEKQHKLEIEKMQSDVELKIVEYSKTKETDIKYDFMGSLLQQAMTNPKGTTESMEGLQNLVNLANEFNDKKSDTK